MDERPSVVVIDHDASVRKLLHVHLAIAGYKVLCAQDAIGGGHLVAQASPCLVVCDANLPYMNGYEFVSALRSDPLTREIPVILLTIKGETHHDAQRLGIVASLKKPVRPERLLELVGGIGSAAAWPRGAHRIAKTSARAAS
ncbi:MAG TPA: response regulator [Burkholderiales bacterium]